MTNFGTDYSGVLGSPIVIVRDCPANLWEIIDFAKETGAFSCERGAECFAVSFLSLEPDIFSKKELREALDSFNKLSPCKMQV